MRIPPRASFPITWYVINGKVGSLKVGVVFVDSNKMRELNQIYRGQDKAVKVLAFPFNEEEPEGIYFLGEIVINLEGIKNKKELKALIEHGVRNLLKHL